MNNDRFETKRLTSFRPIFLVVGVGFLMIIALPGAVKGSAVLKRLLLLFATIAVMSGWFFLFRDGPKIRSARMWRAIVAFTTSVYLSASLPAFALELSSVRWLVNHPLHQIFSSYLWFWAHWGSHGFVQVFFGVIGSLFGLGRARVAFFAGSALLMILWAAMGTWGY